MVVVVVVVVVFWWFVMVSSSVLVFCASFIRTVLVIDVNQFDITRRIELFN